MSDFFGNANGSSGEDQGSLVFDLSGVKEDVGGFEILPKGDYATIVDELEFTESSSGNPMFAAKFKITEGEHEGRLVFDYWVLGGKGADFGLGKLKKFLSRICPEVDMTNFNPKTFADSATAIGREVTVSVGVQKQTKGEYKGEMRNTVRDFQAYGAGGGSFI